VLLADRQILVPEALRAFLPQDDRVVGCAHDGLAVVSEALRLEPEMVLEPSHAGAA
jgi:AmiR/NasT family two-component response regulator